MTEGLSAEPELDQVDEPEFDWHPYVDWPARAYDLIADIEGLARVIELMKGAADDQACQVFVDLLRTVHLAERRELALIILELHGVALPEPGSVKTPQERMSAMMQHVADEVRRKRADIIPERQPFTDRGRHRPGEHEPPS
jgi:hypothetical protein